MSDFERSGTTFEEPGKRRSPGTWFSDLGDRLSRGFGNFDRPAGEEPEWDPYADVEQPTAAADPMEWEAMGHRFPTVLHGYDREAVDVHLAALERELDELRAARLPAQTLEDEIERVGAETSAILRVAHEQATEITRRAQAQADRCVADAAANAVAMTEEAKRKLRALDTETDAVWAERGRLIEDVRNVATALFSLAEDAADRFPEEDKRGPGAAAAMNAMAATRATTAMPAVEDPAAPAHPAPPTAQPPAPELPSAPDGSVD